MGKGISGTKGRDKRLESERLCKDTIRRSFNRIIVWDVSQLGRSLQHLVEFLNKVQSCPSTGLAKCYFNYHSLPALLEVVTFGEVNEVVSNYSVECNK